MSQAPWSFAEQHQLELLELLVIARRRALAAWHSIRFARPGRFGGEQGQHLLARARAVCRHLREIEVILGEPPAADAPGGD